MWRDIGLGDWLFNMDEESEIPGITPTVLKMLTERERSLSKVEQARKFVHERQERMLDVLEENLT